MSSGGNLRFMSWNSNGLKTKMEDVKCEIEKQKCHVVFLQETHSSEVLEDLEDFKSICTTQTSIHRGVAILIKEDIFDESCCTTVRDDDGCYIVVKCTLEGQLFTLVSVYNPPADTRPLMKLVNVVEEISEGILLIGGDFNIALNPYLDRNSRTINKGHLHLKPVVERFITSFQLVDVWRRLHPIDRQYSYQQRKVKSRLDYVFVPEVSMQYVITCEMFNKKCCSDHQPVLFEIRMSKEESENSGENSEFLGIPEEEDKHILDLISSVTHTWLRYKHEYWPKPDLMINPCTPLMISVREIESAIRSLAVNQRHVEHPDGIPLSFYVGNAYALTPSLCAFYHNILNKPMNIPESFNKAFQFERHYRFNVDYLILATILARRLYDHLESHSTNYTEDKINIVAVLFTLKKEPTITWSFLKGLLEKEIDKTPLSDKLKIDVFDRVLRNSSKGTSKSLCWGCPLTPVLITLCLKHIAIEMHDLVEGEDEEDETSKIFISRENVIARFSKDFKRVFLGDFEQKNRAVAWKPVDEILETSKCE